MTSRRPGARAWRFARSELRALRASCRRLGIHRALVERIRWHLELEGVDSATIPALETRIGGRLEAISAEFTAALAQTAGELRAATETLAAQGRLTEAIAARIELGEPAAAHVAGAPTLERLLALGYWLSAQPPSELRVSVIIPTRSRPGLVREAIASVAAQSHAQWELIVVDDGSIDSTRATLARIDDHRVRTVRTDGIGSAGARSAGLELATGQAIAYLDDDNIMLPGWLAAVAWTFSRFDDVDVLYGARIIEDETAIGSDQLLPRLAFSLFDRARLLAGNYIDASVIAHRANLAAARWDAELSGIGDGDLMIRLTADKPALALPTPAVLCRTRAPSRQSNTEATHAATRSLLARLASGRR